MHSPSSQDNNPPTFFRQITRTDVPEAHKLYMPPPDPKHINLAGCFTMDCGGFINALWHDVDGTLTGLGAGSSVMARAEDLSPVRSNAQPTPYRIPAKLLYDPWPSDRRRLQHEEEVGAYDLELDAQALSTNHSLWPRNTRRTQELTVDSYVKPCDPTMAMYDPACRARKRAPYEVAYQGYGLFRGEYSAAATVSQARA